MEAYVHKTANYVRTSSEAYSLAPSALSNRLMHLTNDGVQNTSKYAVFLGKKILLGYYRSSDKYGKFEAGNKLSMQNLCDFLVESNRCGPEWLSEVLMPRIEELVKLTIEASVSHLNPNSRKNFELYIA